MFYVLLYCMKNMHSSLFSIFISCSALEYAMATDYFYRMSLNVGDVPLRPGMGLMGPCSLQNRKKNVQQPNAKWSAISASLVSWASWRLSMSPFFTVASSRYGTYIFFIPWSFTRFIGFEILLPIATLDVNNQVLKTEAAENIFIYS